VEAGVEGKGWGCDEWMELEEHVKDLEISEKRTDQRGRRKRSGRRQGNFGQIEIRGY